MRDFWSFLNNEEIIKQLTTNEELLHEYILSEYENIPKFTITKLAEKLYISPSTVTRYVHKLGLNNFSILKERIREDIKPLKKQSNNLSELYNDINDIDDSQIDKLINTLKSVKYVYIFGTDASSLTAQLLTRSLLSVNICAIYISELSLITFNSSEAVILAISNSGSTNIIKSLVEFTKTNNYQLFSLTKKNSYLHENSKYSLTHSNTIKYDYFDQENQVKILLMITLLTKRLNEFK